MKRFAVLITLAVLAAVCLSLAACGGSHAPTQAGGPAVKFKTPTNLTQIHFITSDTNTSPSVRDGSAGSPTVGETLTATNGTWNNSPTGFTYQWQDCNSSGASCSNISAATISSYVIQSGDIGDTIRVGVTASNGSGSSAVAFSGVTGVVSSSSGFTGTCNATISPSSTSNAVGSAESSLSAGQVLCLNTGSYGTPTTTGACIASNNSSCSGVNANRYTASGTSGNPIIVTSGPGQTATIQGANVVSGSWITLENMNIDEANQISDAISSPITAGANPVPPCNVSVTGKAQAIEFESGSNDSLLNNNIYESIPATREIDIFITANNVTIQHNTISDAGSCGQTEHLIYDDAGSGANISQNWFWSDQFGYGIQIYPNPGTGTYASNVMDGTLDGIIDDTSVGGNAITHNVVINPVTNNAIISGQNSASSGGGFFQASFHDQTGSVDTQTNNAVFNASGGFGVTSSTSFITISGQTTLSNNPFVNGTTTPGEGSYVLCASVMTGCTSGQVTAAGSVGSYGLWNGVGPPTPNPAP